MAPTSPIRTTISTALHRRDACAPLQKSKSSVLLVSVRDIRGAGVVVRMGDLGNSQASGLVNLGLTFASDLHDWPETGFVCLRNIPDFQEGAALLEG